MRRGRDRQQRWPAAVISVLTGVAWGLTSPAAAQLAADAAAQPAAQSAEVRESVDPTAWAGHTVLEVAVTIAGEVTLEPRWVSLVET